MLDFRRAHNRCNFKIAKVEVGVQATDTHPEQMGVVEGKAGASSLGAHALFVISPTHGQTSRANFESSSMGHLGIRSQVQ